MKLLAFLIGILLIIFGVGTFSYQTFSYVTKENVSEIKIPALGELQVTETKEKTFQIPPVASGAALGAGIILVIVAALMRRK